MATPGLSQLVSSIPESAPLAIDTLAKQYKREGRPVIAFGAGEPDADTDSRILEAVRDAVLQAENHHYTPPLGIPEVRAAVADYTNDYLQLDRFSADNVAVTNGGKQALWNSFAAILNPGDEVILPAPYWTTYPEQLKLLGAETRIVETTLENGYRATVEQLREATTPKTKALVLTSPSNPTGSVYTAEEMRDIAAWAEEVGCWVVSDEMYHDFVYDGAEFASIAPHLNPDQLIIVSGLAKSHVLTGWRSGWIVAPKRVISVTKNFQSHTTGNASNLAQRATLAALRDARDVPEQLRSVFAERREIAASIFAQMPGVQTHRPEGAFYFFARVEDLLDGRFEHEGQPVTTSLGLSRFLLDEIDVAIVPGEAFGAPGHLRFSYALATDALREGLERIQRLLVETAQ
ncbi:pyridoxal phosphate-dependent aminotransferase [Leucobacter sp. GX24907]